MAARGVEFTINKIRLGHRTLGAEVADLIPVRLAVTVLLNDYIAK